MTRTAGFATLLLSFSAIFGCASREWSLGSNSTGSEPEDLIFGDITALSELSGEGDQDDATLTRDRLEVFFSSKRETGVGREDVYWARREDPEQSFGEPELVSAANSEERETASSISPDGLTLWFASDREDENEGGLDVWSVVRAARDAPWQTAVHWKALSSPNDDLPRAPWGDARFLPMVIKSEETGHDIYFSERDATGTYQAPVPAEGVNTPGLESDPTLSPDGLSMIFASDAEDSDGDLYVTTRPSMNEPFTAPRPVGGVNSDDEESDPWLSEEGDLLLFSSKRSGPTVIYEAWRQ